MSLFNDYSDFEEDKLDDFGQSLLNISTNDTENKEISNFDDCCEFSHRPFRDIDFYFERNDDYEESFHRVKDYDNFNLIRNRSNDLIDLPLNEKIKDKNKDPKDLHLKEEKNKTKVKELKNNLTLKNVKDLGDVSQCDNSSIYQNKSIEKTKVLNRPDNLKRNLMKSSTEYMKLLLLNEIEKIKLSYFYENDTVIKKFVDYLFDIIIDNKFNDLLYSQHNSKNIASYLQSTLLSYIVNRIITYSDNSKCDQKMYILNKFSNIQDIQLKVLFIISTYKNNFTQIDSIFGFSQTIQEIYQKTISESNNSKVIEEQTVDIIFVYRNLVFYSNHKKKYGEDCLVLINHKKEEKINKKINLKPFPIFCVKKN